MEICCLPLSRVDYHYRVQLVFALELRIFKFRRDNSRVKVEVNEARVLSQLDYNVVCVAVYRVFVADLAVTVESSVVYFYSSLYSCDALVGLC